MKCQQCDLDTNNPKFCSKSCSATYNNVRYPKRHMQGICKRCSISCTSERTYCKECWHEVERERSTARWEEVTLRDMRGVGNANAGSKYPYIRALARKKYIQSGLPQWCVYCGYSTHFDVAHIKDVKSFDLEATVSEINDLSNLVALCKNHHWEFDHGALEIIH